MRARSRLPRLGAAVLAVVLAACAQDPTPAPPGGGGPGASATPDAAPVEPDAGPTGGGRSSGDDGDGAGEPQVPNVRLPSDTAAVGAMCRAYLRPEVPRLAVELDWQDGAQPTQDAVSHLLAVLRSVSRKPVELAPGSASVGAGDAEHIWTAQQLRATARRHRAQRTSAQQVVVYVLAVRGRFEDEGVIGVAHNATEMAIFPDRIGGLGPDLLGGRGALERSVLVHELGHLLCLINLSYRSELDHEDPEHPHHSRDRKSVMHWAIDTSAIGQVFRGPPPDDFTAQDRADLDGLRTGRY